MENLQGDLTDILRATNCENINNNDTAASLGLSASLSNDWRFQSYSTDPVDDFGDPFTLSRDPLLHDIDTPVSSHFFHNVVPDDVIENCNVEETGTSSTLGFFQKDRVLDLDFDDEMIKRRMPSSNIFSSVLQISPTSAKPSLSSSCDNPRQSLVGSTRTLMAGNDDHHHHHVLNVSLQNNSEAVESFSGLQISSPRNTGIEQRKSQAKKVICIPAPTPANSRASTGEIVPSDLWAWRKYGQKPIKGSPYPRGYYRCSSSKGCSARKQVERSRTDPNMLVITYTSEHNHPWPTQRNALAGSTRSQQSKNHHNNSNPTSSSIASQNHQEQKANNESPNYKSKLYDHDQSSVTLKENMDLNHFDDSRLEPTLLEDSNTADDHSFFAELGEIIDHQGNNSLDMLMLGRGYSGTDDDNDGFGSN